MKRDLQTFAMQIFVEFVRLRCQFGWYQYAQRAIFRGRWKP